MFENIIGTDNRLIDNKYRMILPKFTGCEVGEKLVLILKEDYLEIKELNVVLEELKELRLILKSAQTVEMFNFYQDKINEITSSIENIVEPDKQNRITLGKDVVTKYNLTEGIKTEGVIDSLRVWNFHKFQEYQKKVSKISRK